jgi:Zn-dependent protease
MFISLMEIIDMLIMIGVLGFVFMNAFKIQKKHNDNHDDILDKYLKKSKFFNWHDFWFAVMIVAPAIILHEIGHKAVALSFGLSAEFHAAYVWLAIAVILRLFNSPFIFFVPAFVAIAGLATPGENALIAFAGPGINLIIFLIAIIALKTQKLSSKSHQLWMLTKNINLFLFIFNMLPIPYFDGFKVWEFLWHLVGL